MVLVNLFLSFLRIGLFAIGGAHSFLPLIEKEVVQNFGWLSKEEFLDVLGVVKVFPGAISIKFATYTGYKLAGILGAIAANLGNLLGPAILIMFGSGLYLKYKHLAGVKAAFNAVELAVFALLIALAFQLINVSELAQLKNLLIIAVSFVLFTYTKVHPALIIVGIGFLGTILRRI